MNIKLPKSIFKDLQNLNIKKVHRDFALAFIVFNMYMYENCLYRYRTPNKAEIKSILGISSNNKTIDYIVKAKGEISKYLFTLTRNYPIYENENGKVFVYDLPKQERDIYLARNKPNFKIFAPSEDYYDRETFEIDEEILHFFMSNSDLGYKSLYFYILFKCISDNGHCEVSTKELVELTGDNEKDISYRTKILESHNCIIKRYDMIKRNFRININDSTDFSKERNQVNRNIIRKTTEQFKKEVYALVGDSHTVLSNYINSTTKVKMKHNVCGYEWMTEPGAFLHVGVTCPYCNLSSNEKEIANWLNKYEINYEIQYRFDDCKYKKPLPFDFAVFNDKDELILLIEYDGEQHFREVKFGGKNDTESINIFKETKIRDKIKDEYCKTNNYRLLRIPYFEFDNYEELLFKEFIEIAKR